MGYKGPGPIRRLGLQIMLSTSVAETLLSELMSLLERIDEVRAPIAAAYLDSAVEALCSECGLLRDKSISD
jgi:hypothetical protein